MPVVLKLDIVDATIILWRITESEDELAHFVCTSDINFASSFLLSKRRLEHLAWKAALRVVIPDAEISYNNFGAPEIINHNKQNSTYIFGGKPYISVSHTNGMAAVMISSKRCAIDIEILSRNFMRSSCRYISDKESALNFDRISNFEAIVWCAKESMYKYAQREELDLKRNLIIEHVDNRNGVVKGVVSYSVKNEESVKTDRITLQIMEYDGYIIVYTQP